VLARGWASGIGGEFGLIGEGVAVGAVEGSWELGVWELGVGSWECLVGELELAPAGELGQGHAVVDASANVDDSRLGGGEW